MAALGIGRSGSPICDPADAGMAQDEPASLRLRIHDGYLSPAAGNGGRSIHYSGLAIDGTRQEVPCLHLSISRDFRGEQRMGLQQKPCG